MSIRHFVPARAGQLRGLALPVVDAETIPLWVHAEAALIVEGTLDLKTMTFGRRHPAMTAQAICAETWQCLRSENTRIPANIDCLARTVGFLLTVTLNQVDDNSAQRIADVSVRYLPQKPESGVPPGTQMLPHPRACDGGKKSMPPLQQNRATG